jgi:hypothetical protein
MVDIYCLTFVYDLFLQPSVAEKRESVLDENAPLLKAHALALLEAAPHVKAHFESRFESHA